MKNNPPTQKAKSESSGLNKRHPVLACILLGLAILMMPVALQAAAPAIPAAVKTAVNARLVETYGKLPLSFEANQGQTGDQVKFVSRGPGYTLFLTPSEAVLALRPSGAKPPSLRTMHLAGEGRGEGEHAKGPQQTSFLHMQLFGRQSQAANFRGGGVIR